MKKPKVAIIVSHPIQHFCPQYSSYHANPNWITKVFFASAMGYKPYQDKDFKETVSWDNLRMNEFDYEFLNGEQVIPVNPKLDAPTIGQSLEKYQPDVIIVYGYIQKFQRRATKWAKKNGVKVFMIGDSELAHKRSFFKSIAKKILLTQYFKKIDRVLTVGNSNEYYYYNYGVALKKMTRVGFSFDIRQYEAAYPNRKQLNQHIRKTYEISPDAITISVVGKLIERKKQKDLILALQLLEQKSALKYVLFVIGSGPQMEELKELAKQLTKNRVIFTGFTKPEELPSYYATTNIYIHPAIMEPHSLAISEAAYMNSAIIVSDTCGSHGPMDDVQAGKNGFVYTQGDLAELTTKIVRLANDRELLEKFGTYSHDFMVESQKRAHATGLQAALLAEGLL